MIAAPGPGFRTDNGVAKALETVREDERAN